VLVESLEAICAPSTATMKGLLNKNGFLGAQQTPRPDAQQTPRPDAQQTPRPKTGRIMSRQEQVRRGCVFTCLVCSCICLCSSHFCFVIFVLFSSSCRTTGSPSRLSLISRRGWRRPGWDHCFFGTAKKRSPNTRQDTVTSARDHKRCDRVPQRAGGAGPTDRVKARMNRVLLGP
jgi:hypothetical protein